MGGGKKNDNRNISSFFHWESVSYLGFAFELDWVQQHHLERRHLQPLVETCLWGLEILVCLLRLMVQVQPFIQLFQVLLLEEREEGTLLSLLLFPLRPWEKQGFSQRNNVQNLLGQQCPHLFGHPAVHSKVLHACCFPLLCGRNPWGIPLLSSPLTLCGSSSLKGDEGSKMKIDPTQAELRLETDCYWSFEGTNFKNSKDGSTPQKYMVPCVPQQKHWSHCGREHHNRPDQGFTKNMQNFVFVCLGVSASDLTWPWESWSEAFKIK